MRHFLSRFFDWCTYEGFRPRMQHVLLIKCDKHRHTTIPLMYVHTWTWAYQTLCTSSVRVLGLCHPPSGLKSDRCSPMHVCLRMSCIFRPCQARSSYIFMQCMPAFVGHVLSAFLSRARYKKKHQEEKPKKCIQKEAKHSSLVRTNS